VRFNSISFFRFSAGNIDSKTVNSDTTDFEYTGDLMTDIGDDELTWDYNGQLTESVIASLEYNWSGKLRSATAGSDSISLKYDPMGNRVYKEIGGTPDVKRRYIVDIASRLPIILCVIDADDGSLERSYIYAGAQPIAFYEGDYTDPAYIYLYDRLGSVRQVLDESGNVKNTYTYTPFGQDPNSQFAETVDNPFMFTGQWYDSEIGQYYLRARMYDPQIMRLTARDPAEVYFQEPLMLHRYLYCGNDPINWIDPSGEFLESIFIANEMHNSAIDLAVYGVSQGELDYLDFAIDLENEKGEIAQASSYWAAPMAVDAILRCAIKWLGDYEAVDAWVFRSKAHQERLFRMTNSDLLGHKGGKPHVNFEIQEKDSRGNITNVTSIHVPFF